IYTIEELKANSLDIMNKVEAEAREQFANSSLTFDLVGKVRNGEIYVDQGIIAGCSGGTYDNIVAAANILENKSIGNGAFTMSVYPGSQPVYIELVKNGTIAALIDAGVIIREAFCGPCFGAGDTPANQGFSIRHTTRNFPNREGSKPNEGQLSYVALMDARSIAATARNGGKLTAANEEDFSSHMPTYAFSKKVYDKRVYNGVGRAEPNTQLQFGPNIKDWPIIPSLTDNLLLKVVSYITDPVTTTDELIPSGETSSFRSNPLRLAEFTLSRKDPSYVMKAKEIHAYEQLRAERSTDLLSAELAEAYAKIKAIQGYEAIDPFEVGIGSAIFANKPGDGSAREQAASCQRVLGGWANLAKEYATKRYRSNLINWGIVPLLIVDEPLFTKDSFIFIPDLKNAILSGSTKIRAYVLGDSINEIALSIGELTNDEKNTIVAGCLINYYKR
ncbi:MAG: hydratase, partial [Sporomusa sp.]